MGNGVSCTIFNDEIKGKITLELEKTNDLFKEIDKYRNDSDYYVQTEYRNSVLYHKNMVFITYKNHVLAIHRQFNSEGEVSYKYDTGSDISKPLTKIPVSKKQIKENNVFADSIIEAILDEKESSITNEDFKRLVSDTINWHDWETKTYSEFRKREKMTETTIDGKKCLIKKVLKWAVNKKGRGVTFKITTIAYQINLNDQGPFEEPVLYKNSKYIYLRINKEGVLKKNYLNYQAM